MLNREKTLDSIISIVMNAGKEVLKIYNSEAQIKATTLNKDSSQAEVDRVAHHFICDELKRLSPSIPILSEESAKNEVLEHRSWDRYWLIDPIDGTREFFSRTGQFTINIALIENHIPILGAVYVPVENVCYFASHKGGAYKRDKSGKEIAMSAHKKDSKETVVVVSNYEKNPLLDRVLQLIGPYSLIKTGSSVKICLVAEGVADVYPRLFPIAEWDTGAAHCILLEAGGDLYVNYQTALRYNQNESLLIPNFLAISNDRKDLLTRFSDLQKES